MLRLKATDFCFKTTCWALIVFVFGLTVLTGSAGINSAQAAVFDLPGPQQAVPLSSAFSSPVLRGLRLNPSDPLNIEFIIDTAGEKEVSKEEAAKLIRYFLAGLTVPEKDLWVNLSPYEQDRIIPEELSQTDAGKDLLSQDYILKQLLASVTDPESSTGKDYWNKTYQEMVRIFRSSNLPVNTFNKVWIAPATAQVYEHDTLAFINNARLKVLLDQDVVARNAQAVSVRQAGAKASVGDEVASQVMKDLILPKIEADINTGKNFAGLRQVYYSLILAKWFKEKFRASFYRYYIDQKKIQGIDLADKAVKEKVFNLYVQAFSQGLYDRTKSDIDPLTRKKITRRYFSGGCVFDAIPLDNPAVAASQMKKAADKYQLFSAFTAPSAASPMTARYLRAGLLGAMAALVVFGGVSCDKQGIDNYLNQSPHGRFNSFLDGLESWSADKEIKNRIAAIEKMTDQKRLAKISLDEQEYSAVRAAAIGRLTDQEALVKVVLAISKDEDFLVIDAAMEKLTDQSALTKIALDVNIKVSSRLDAVEKLTEQTTLTKIALSDENRWIRCYATEKLTDQNVLTQIALNDKSYRVRETAVKKLTDQNVLGQVALNDKDAELRGRAVEKLTDQKILERIASDNNEYMRVRAMAEERIKYLNTEKSSNLSASPMTARYLRAGLLGAMAALVVFGGVSCSGDAWNDYLNQSPYERAHGGLERVFEKQFGEPWYKTQERQEKKSRDSLRAVLDSKNRVFYNSISMKIDPVETKKHRNSGYFLKKIKETKDTSIQQHWVDLDCLRELAKISTKYDNDTTLDRFFYIQYVSDSILAQISMFAPHDGDRLAAIKKLKDQNILARLALNGSAAWVRKSAVERLTDQNVLAQVVLNDKDVGVRGRAVGKLTDQKVLAQVALNDEGLLTRAAATERLQKIRGGETARSVSSPLKVRPQYGGINVADIPIAVSGDCLPVEIPEVGAGLFEWYSLEIISLNKIDSLLSK